MSRGILSWGDFVLGGILSRGILSGGFCPGGFCPGGFCPDTPGLSGHVPRASAPLWPSYISGLGLFLGPPVAFLYFGPRPFKGLCASPTFLYFGPVFSGDLVLAILLFSLILYGNLLPAIEQVWLHMFTFFNDSAQASTAVSQPTF